MIARSRHCDKCRAIRGAAPVQPAWRLEIGDFVVTMRLADGHDVRLVVSRHGEKAALSGLKTVPVEHGRGDSPGPSGETTDQGEFPRD